MKKKTMSLTISQGVVRNLGLEGDHPPKMCAGLACAADSRANCSEVRISSSKRTCLCTLYSKLTWMAGFADASTVNKLQALAKAKRFVRANKFQL